MMLVPLMHLFTVAQAMIHASSPSSQWSSIFQNTAGIVFLGTPHRGSSSTKGSWFLGRSSLFHPTASLLRVLRANSSLLARIADQFNNIWGSRPIFTFRETKGMVGFGIGIVIYHLTFLQHLFHQLLLSGCLQGRCDHKLSKRADI